MNQQRLLLEFSPWWIPVCLAAGILYAALLYSAPHPWSKTANRVLTAGRAILVAVLAFLLLGPLLKMIENEFEKAVWVVLVDDSQSVRAGLPEEAVARLKTSIGELQRGLEAGGYAAETRTLSGTDSLQFAHPSSDLAGAFRKIANDYEGKNLAGVVLVSDGLYNQSGSPLYLDFRVPVLTVGVGDTVQRPDLSVRHVAANKIVYQGNRFPVRVEILAAGLPQAGVTVRLLQSQRLLAAQTKTLNEGPLVVFDFEVDAIEKGLQRLEVDVVPLPGERNLSNNRFSVFFEVADGKKRIALLAPGPHPDIKAIEAVVQAQQNYEWRLHLAGVTPNPPDLGRESFDLVILHEALDPRMEPFLRQARALPGAVWLITGGQTNTRAFGVSELPVVFENTAQQDEVTPVLNPSFRDFAFSENTGERIARYPPVTVPFGKFTYPPDAQVLLHQRIGTVSTPRPLLFTWNENQAKRALLLAEGLWRWRLHEFRETERTEAFQEWVGKLIQFLATREDKSRFRCYPLNTEFAGHEPVVLESQLFNELLEPLYGYPVELEITNEQRQTSRYSYTTRAGNTRYAVGNLPQGVYRYRARTTWNGVTETAGGQFMVNVQNPEASQTAADFGLLRRLSEKTGGRFYPIHRVDSVALTVARTPAKAIVRSSETYQSLLYTPWLFVFLLLLVCVEWVARKYLGGY